MKVIQPPPSPFALHLVRGLWYLRPEDLPFSSPEEVLVGQDDRCLCFVREKDTVTIITPEHKVSLPITTKLRGDTRFYGMPLATILGKDGMYEHDFQPLREP